MILVGLVGKSLVHSFSPQYFKNKFEKKNIQHVTYQAYQISSIQEIINLIKENPTLVGFNVTVPYKESIIPFLDSLDISAKKVGAVNVVKIFPTGEKIGYNTDYYGFFTSLKRYLGNESIHKALILGSGGGSKAVQAVLKDMQIDFTIVSRSSSYLTYEDLNDVVVNSHALIINTTPLGMFPQIENHPQIPYHALTSKHFLYDLVYNPAETIFLQKGKAQDAHIKNGLEMLTLQAEASWDIWKDLIIENQ